MILVTGAFGKVGSDVVRALAAAAVPARALVRDPAKAGALPKGVVAAVGALDDAASLDRACDGVEAVFMGSFDHPDVLALQANLIAAAKRAGVRRMARLSALSTDEASAVPFARTHATGDRQVLESGIAGIALRPGWFHQNFLTFFPKGVMPGAAGEGRVAFIDTRDIAEIAVRVLTAPGWEGQAIDLTGPEPLTHAEVATTLSRVTGRAFHYADFTPDAFRREMIARGASPAYADILDYLYGRIRSGAAATVSDGVRRVLGRDPAPLAQFAKDYASDLIRQL